MSKASEKAAKAVRRKFRSAELIEFRDEHTLVVPLERLIDVMTFCRDEQGFDYLVDVSSLDHFGEDPRFEMVYELFSYASGAHLRVRTKVPEDTEVPTVSELWATADWHEREVFDMMGIRFSDHPDLRRILMWEGYPYYPLRKDFPLAGKPSEMPDVAFTGVAPLAGGPFVTSPTDADTIQREPRSREMS